MINPINLQVKRTDGSWDIIESAPYAIRERSMENIALTGAENPGYLGELPFSGIGYFERCNGIYLIRKIKQLFRQTVCILLICMILCH